MSTKAEQDIEYLIQKEEEGTLTRAEKTRLVRLLTLKKGREKRTAAAQSKKKEQYVVEEPQTESESEYEEEPEEEEPQEEIPKPKLKRATTKSRSYAVAKPISRASTPADSTFPMQIYEQLARQELMIKRLMKKKPDGLDKKIIEKIPEPIQKTAPVEAKSESIITQSQKQQKAPDPEKVQALRKKILF
jgi:hypothetical protein